MKLRSPIPRLHLRQRRRLHATAAILLLGLYAAAVWHGTGGHHVHPAEAHAGCGSHACAPEPASSPAHGAGHDPEDTDSHACALCTLLKAPATPGILLAAPAVQPTEFVEFPAPASVARIALVGYQPSRAPPSLSA